MRVGGEGEDRCCGVRLAAPSRDALAPARHESRSTLLATLWLWMPSRWTTGAPPPEGEAKKKNRPNLSIVFHARGPLRFHASPRRFLAHSRPRHSRALPPNARANRRLHPARGRHAPDTIPAAKPMRRAIAALPLAAALIAVVRADCEPGFAPRAAAAAGACTDCVPCAPGTVKPVAGCGACEPCAPGFVAAADRFACVPCPAGAFFNTSVLEGAGVCQPCTPGTFSAAGAMECVLCPFNTFAAVAGSAECSACPAGKFALLGARACSLWLFLLLLYWVFLLGFYFKAALDPLEAFARGHETVYPAFRRLTSPCGRAFQRASLGFLAACFAPLSGLQGLCSCRRARARSLIAAVPTSKPRLAVETEEPPPFRARWAAFVCHHPGPAAPPEPMSWVEWAMVAVGLLLAAQAIPSSLSAYAWGSDNAVESFVGTVADLRLNLRVTEASRFAILAYFILVAVLSACTVLVATTLAVLFRVRTTWLTRPLAASRYLMFTILPLLADMTVFSLLNTLSVGAPYPSYDFVGIACVVTMYVDFGCLVVLYVFGFPAEERLHEGTSKLESVLQCSWRFSAAVLQPLSPIAHIGVVLAVTAAQVAPVFSLPSRVLEVGRVTLVLLQAISALLSGVLILGGDVNATTIAWVVLCALAVVVGPTAFLGPAACGRPPLRTGKPIAPTLIAVVPSAATPKASTEVAVKNLLFFKTKAEVAKTADADRDTTAAAIVVVPAGPERKV